MPIQSINPANGQLLLTFAPLTEDAVQARIALAHAACPTFGAISIEHRARWMRKLAGILEHEVEELAALLTLEMGKTLASARQEILKCVAGCRFYAENAAQFLAEEPLPFEHNAFVRYDSLGVILAIMPWNFPFWQVFRFLAPALMAGNVALLKHAANVPQCALAIEALVRRAGFPRGVFQTLLLELHQVESVLSDERVAAVTVTGSEAAGRAVGAQAGWLIKPAVLELGGSDPFVVMPSADLEQAVAAAVKARCMNNGQSCIAAKRFIVHQDLYEDFETRFVMAMDSLTIGDPTRESTDIGPLATTQLLQQIEEQVQAATAAGARLLTGGKRIPGPGNFFEPTILAGVPRSAPVYREEFFGPVAMLFPVASLAEAIAVANDTPFGLGASIWTTDPAEQECLIAQLQCGQVFVNTVVASDPRLPFGGIKRSGFGRELSAIGIRAFLNAKTVVVAQPVQQAEIPFVHEVDADPDPGIAASALLSAPQHAPEPGLVASTYNASKFRQAFQTPAAQQK